MAAQDHLPNIPGKQISRTSGPPNFGHLGRWDSHRLSVIFAVDEHDVGVLEVSFDAEFLQINPNLDEPTVVALILVNQVRYGTHGHQLEEVVVLRIRQTAEVPIGHEGRQRTAVARVLGVSRHILALLKLEYALASLVLVQ